MGILPPLSCSTPDDEVDKVSLEPDSISFMETLLARGRGQVGLQNGFSPTVLEEDQADDPEGGGTIMTAGGEDDNEKSSTPPGQICPVGLHKAVLLYPLMNSHSEFFAAFVMLNEYKKMHRNTSP